MGVMDTTADPPVDLAALRRAIAPVVAWYEQFLAGRPMPVRELDQALLGLARLPPLGGRLGRAVALVARAGRDATTDETIAALELLRHTTGLRHVPIPPPPPASKPRRRRRKPDWAQPPLPGIGEP